MAEKAHLAELRRKPPGYAEDYAAWVEHQVAMLAQRRFDELDTVNLADEVGDLGASNWRGFVSAIRLVVLHMLKWDHQPGLRSRSWQASIAVQRNAIADAIQQSPSYGARTDLAITRAYSDARREASGETDLPLKTFPEACPYDWAAITTRDHRLDGDD